MRKKIEDKKFHPDPEMQQILQGSIDAHETILNRAKEYLRTEELKLDRAKKRLQQYNQGKLHNEN